ncbi:MAG: 1,2-phenylacetyl-CoA epoxidase subunit PaaE [Thermaurantimonas sp.]|uniref:1,2-phenylacetyl-CoA epoxidase subunit PaaE n=1 Tax=Thermaurantimonas sp. TaxID=2681568 RepID=UPI003919373F
MLSFFLQKKKTANKYNFWLDDLKKQPRPKFHPLRISDIRRETDECVSIAFEIPDSLRDDYRFVAGQYLTLKTTIDGEEVRRSYSICSSPLDGELRVAVKKVHGGKFSTYANEKLAVGQTLEVMTPQGNFNVPFKKDNVAQYVMFAAGSGITPIMSLIKTILQFELQSSVILFYGNKAVSTIIFKDELDDLKNTYLNRLEIHHILSREDQGTDWLKGRIDAQKVRLYAQKFFNPSGVAHYFICGPEEMIHQVKDTLAELGVSDKKVHFELFTTNTTSAEKKVVDTSSSKGEILSHVTVILDGEETHFDVSSKGISILDAALDAGADVPFACKGAVCCTCRAKVLVGKVVMEMNYALDDDEVEQGYVLTCQSHPITERVVVSYDE